MSWGLGGNEMGFNNAGDHLLRHHYTYTVMDTVLLCLCTLINLSLCQETGTQP